MPDKVEHFVVYLDCQCSGQFFVFNSDKSQTIKPWQRRTLKRAAKKLGRQFVESGTSFTCPSCSATSILKPDEKYEFTNGELIKVG